MQWIKKTNFYIDKDILQHVASRKNINQVSTKNFNIYFFGGGGGYKFNNFLQQDLSKIQHILTGQYVRFVQNL